MSILDKIKEEAKKSGQSKGKFMYFKEDEKRRVRFLTDMDDGMEITFHDSFEKGVNIPCQELFGRDCQYCADEDLRTRSLYAWSVYDYEAKAVKIFMQAVNNCTAVPALMALYETYGTLTDRDLVITKSGKQQNTTFAVVPMDRNKFRNTKVKALSEEAVLKYLDQAYPDPDREDGEDEEDEEPVRKHATSKAKPKSGAKEKPPFKEDKPKKSKKPVDDEEDEDSDWEDEEDNEDVIDYTTMSAKDLYKLCKERCIEVQPKKPEKYYISALKDYDKAQDDWDDEEEESEDEWEDEE